MIGQQLNRILVIDDDEGMRTVLEIALGDLSGYTLLLCESGADALRQAAGFQPDLLIIDSMMPGMDGATTLTALRQVAELATTPAIGITAGYADVTFAQLPHVIGMLRKPFYPQTIAREIEGLWSAPAASASGSIGTHQLEQLRQRYRESLASQCARLQREHDQATPATLTQTRALLHQLIGTGTTLGFERIGSAGRDLSQQIHELQLACLHPASNLSGEQAQRFQSAIDTFLAAIEQACDEQPSWAGVDQATATAQQEPRA